MLTIESYGIRFLLLVPLSWILTSMELYAQINPALAQPVQKHGEIGKVKSRADSLVSVFQQPNYGLYLPNGELLIDQQGSAIPAIIPLLSDTSYQKLIDTFDLIYPGATKFYGHGQVVPYELDWIAVRAGWLIEQITFENFGYSGRLVSESELIEIHKANYQSYLQTGSHDVDFSSVYDRSHFRSELLTKAQRVRAWWDTNKNGWTRIDALKRALESGDSLRQIHALSYLRYARTECEGLSPQSFQERLLPSAQKLTASSNETIREQATLLVQRGFSWAYKETRK